MKYLLLSLGILSFSNIYAQCDSFNVFTSQGQIDSFRMIYGQCDSLYSLSLVESYGITNVDSLIGIKHLTYFSIRLSDSSKLSISGLKDLTSVGVLIASTLGDFDQEFANLKSVDSLHLNYLDKTSNFKLFRKLVHVDRLSISGDGPLDALESLEVDRNSKIIINNRVGGKLSDIIPDSLRYIKDLSLSRLENFDVSSGINLDTFNILTVAFSKNMDLSNLVERHVLSSLAIVNVDETNKFYNGFIHATSLKTLLLDRISFMEGISELVPNLSAVSKFLIIKRNPLLTDIEPLAFLDIPEASDLSLSIVDHYVHVGDNPRLNVCDISYMCNALKTYPDEVLIYSNGPRCDRDTLLMEGCRTTGLDDVDLDDVEVFPNPAMEVLHIRGFTGGYQLISSTGHILSFGRIEQEDDVSLAHLPASASFYLRLIKDDAVRVIPITKSP